MARVNKAMREAEERIKAIAEEQKFKAELPARIAKIYHLAQSLVLNTKLDLDSTGHPILYIAMKDKDGDIMYEDTLDMKSEIYEVEYTETYLNNLVIARQNEITRRNRAVEIFKAMTPEDRLIVNEYASYITIWKF